MTMRKNHGTMRQRRRGHACAVHWLDNPRRSPHPHTEHGRFLYRKPSLYAQETTKARHFRRPDPSRPKQAHPAQIAAIYYHHHQHYQHYHHLHHHHHTAWAGCPKATPRSGGSYEGVSVDHNRSKVPRPCRHTDSSVQSHVRPHCPS